MPSSNAIMLQQCYYNMQYLALCHVISQVPLIIELIQLQHGLSCENKFETLKQVKQVSTMTRFYR